MLLEGKTGLVFGVANKRSIAWGIAQTLAGAGARLAFHLSGARRWQRKAIGRHLAGLLDDSMRRAERRRNPGSGRSGRP